jgi:hypothetical protein
MKGTFSMHSQSTQQLRLTPTKYQHVYNVQLVLDSGLRFIGTLDQAGEGTFYTKRSSKHVYRNSNSLALNYELLQRPDFKFKWIIIEFDGRRLTSSKEFFLRYGARLNFKRAGFEKQISLRLDLFGESKAKDFENACAKQEELFEAREAA